MTVRYRIQEDETAVPVALTEVGAKAEKLLSALQPSSATGGPEPEDDSTITAPVGRQVNFFGPARSGIGRYRDERPNAQEKATVLLLHGWAGTAELNWSHVYAPLVSAGYRVLAPDLAGHGQGAKDVAFTIEGSADAVARLVRDSGVARVFVVGHSMGGSIALVFARRHPELVLGLVLMATQTSWPGIPPTWFLRVAGRLATVAAGPVLCWGARSILGADADRNRWIREELSHTSIPHLAQALAALRGFNAEPWLSHVQVPTVVLVTTKDNQVAPERQRLLAAGIKGAMVMEVDIGHSDPASRPGLFPERLVAAIERLAGSGASMNVVGDDARLE